MTGFMTALIYSRVFKKRSDGHAVKVGYLLTGMAAVAAHTKDEQLLAACRSIYDNIINQRMYLTGGIGSSRHQERFTFDYDLPNDRAYAETCAAVSLSFLHSQDAGFNTRQYLC